MKIILLLALSFFAHNCYAQPGQQDSLLLYLPFNGNTNDESGNNNHGLVMNAALTSDRLGNASVFMIQYESDHEIGIQKIIRQ